MLIRASKTVFDSLFVVRRCRSDQNGTALTEFAIAVPLLATLILGMVDVGALMINYVQFEQAAREGVRTAGRLVSLDSTAPHFSPNNIATSNEKTICDASPNLAMCGHTLIHSRVRHILRTQNTWSVDLLNVQVTSNFDPLPGGCAVVNPDEDSVEIQLNGLYQGYFISYNMNVTMRGPYLFQRTATTTC